MVIIGCRPIGSVRPLNDIAEVILPLEIDADEFIAEVISLASFGAYSDIC